MPKIDNLKTLLNFNISDGSKNIPVYINENNERSINGIFIFYNNDNNIMSIGQHTGSGYYQNGIQIVCRHNDYAKSRAMAFDTMEYISKNRKAYQGIYFMPDTSPRYTGIDDRTAGYTWSFEIYLRGGE